MPKETAYDYVLYKVPTEDKYGNDISNDRIDTSGRRRSNGTISGPAYDPVLLDDDVQLVRKSDLASRHVRYEDLSVAERIMVDFIDTVVTRAAAYATDKVIQSFENWLLKRKARKQVAETKVSKPVRLIPKVTQTVVEQPTKKSEMNKPEQYGDLFSGFRDAYNFYTGNMSSEEAQKEFIDAYFLSLLAMRKLWRIANSTITDGPNKASIDGCRMLDELCSAKVMDNFNLLLSQNPELMEIWECQVLTEILRREPVVNEKFIPLGQDELRSVFMFQNNAPEDNGGVL